MVQENSLNTDKVNSVNILGLVYEIEEVEVVNKETLRAGEINFIQQVIKIDKTLSAERKHIALLHEILHGICEQLGFDELNEQEQVIQSLANALYQVLKSQTISF